MRGQWRSGHHRRRRRLYVKDLHPNLLCILCGGYYVDATTIVECLHSFCRTCIVRYLESSKFCPICDVQVHKTRPLLSIRPDKTLQDIVYKLVPGLYQHEMCRRLEYYKCQGENRSSGPEDGGCSVGRKYVLPDDPVSLALTPTVPNGSQHNTCYSDIGLGKNDNSCYSVGCSSNQKDKCNARCSVRYLQCPAGVSVGQLKRLLRAKFGVAPNQPIALIAKNEPSFSDHLTLVDVAYITSWQKTEPLQLQYCIYERGSKNLIDQDIFKSECNSECYGICEMPKLELAVSVNNQTFNHSDTSAVTYEAAPVLEAVIPSQETQRQRLSLASSDDTYAKYMKQYHLNKDNTYDLQSVDLFDKCQTNEDLGNIISEDLKKSYLEPSQDNLSSTFCNPTQNTFMTQNSVLNLTQNEKNQYTGPATGIDSIEADMATDISGQTKMPVLLCNNIGNDTQNVYSQAEQSEGKEVQLCISETGVMSISGSDTTDNWLNSIGTEACELLSKIESETICQEINLKGTLEKDNEGTSLKRKDENNHLKSEKRKKVYPLESIEPSISNKSNENKIIYKEINDNISNENEKSLIDKDIGTKDKKISTGTDPVVQKNTLNNPTDKTDTHKKLESTNSETINRKSVTVSFQNKSQKNIGDLQTNKMSLTMTNTEIHKTTKTKVFVATSIENKEDSYKDSKCINNTNKSYGTTKKLPIIEKSDKKNLKQNITNNKSSFIVPSKKDIKVDNSKTYRRTQPYGYKTLKMPPKSWNPTISRESLALGSSKSSNSNSTCNPPRTNKIFKARNAPKIPDNSLEDKSLISEGSSGGNVSSGSNSLHNKVVKKFIQGVCENDEMAPGKKITLAATKSSLCLATTKTVATPTTSALVITTTTPSTSTPCKTESKRHNVRNLSHIKSEIPIKSDPDLLNSEVPNTQIKPDHPGSIEKMFVEDGLMLTNQLTTTSQPQICATNKTLIHSNQNTLSSLKKCDLCCNIGKNINNPNISSNICSCPPHVNTSNSKDNLGNKISNNNTKNKSQTVYNNGTENKVNADIGSSIVGIKGFNGNSSLNIANQRDYNLSIKNNEGCGDGSFNNRSFSDPSSVTKENLHYGNKIPNYNVNKSNSGTVSKNSISGCPSPIANQNISYSGLKAIPSIPTTSQTDPCMNTLEQNPSISNNKHSSLGPGASAYKSLSINAVRMADDETSNASKSTNTITTTANSSLSKSFQQTHNKLITPLQSKTEKKTLENNQKKNLMIKKEKETPGINNINNIKQGENIIDQSIPVTSQAEMSNLASIPKIQTCIEGSPNILSLSQPQYSLNSGSLGIKQISPGVSFPSVINTLTLPCYSSSISYPQFPYVYSGSNAGLWNPSASFIPSYYGCLPTQGIATANLLSEVPSEGGSLPIIPLISPLNSQGSILTSSASSLGSILTPAPFQNPMITTSALSPGLTLTSVTTSPSSIQSASKLPVSTSSASYLGLSASSSAPIITSSFSGPLTVSTASSLGSVLSASKQSLTKTPTSLITALKADPTSNQCLSATENIKNISVSKEDSLPRGSGHLSSVCPKIIPESKSLGTLPKNTAITEREILSQGKHISPFEVKVSEALESESGKTQYKVKQNPHNLTTLSDPKAICQSSTSSTKAIKNDEIAQTSSFNPSSPKLEVQSKKNCINDIKTIASPITSTQSLILPETHKSPSSNNSTLSPSLKPETFLTQQNTVPLSSSQQWKRGNSEATERIQSPSLGKSKDDKVHLQQSKHEILSINESIKAAYDQKLSARVNTVPSGISGQSRTLFSQANTPTNWQCDAKQSTQAASFLQNNQLISSIGPSINPVENSAKGHFSKFPNYSNSQYTLPSYNASPLHPSLEAISQLLENENFIKPDKNKLQYSPSLTPDIFSGDKNPLQLGSLQTESCQVPGTHMPFGTHSLEKANTCQRDSLGRQMLQKLPNMSELPFPGSPFPIQVPNVSTASTVINNSMHSIPTRTDYCQVSSASNKVFDALNVFGASPMFSIPIKCSDTATSHASYASKTFSQSSIDAKAYNKGSPQESLKNNLEVSDKNNDKVYSEFSSSKVSNIVNQQQLLIPNNMSISGSQGQYKMTHQSKVQQNDKQHLQMNNSEKIVNKESTAKAVEKKI